MRDGPLYCLAVADSQPCCGSFGTLTWRVKNSGRGGHSGFPQNCINSIALATAVTNEIQERFCDDYPPTDGEAAYLFRTGCHMKPLQLSYPPSSTNQILPWLEVHGDIRYSPFYQLADVLTQVEQYVADVNDHIEDLPTFGVNSSYVLPPEVNLEAGENRRATVEFEWGGARDTFKLFEGVKVRLDTVGHKAMIQAFRETYGGVRPFSIGSSLPWLKIYQEQGFDVQMFGFGRLPVFHGVDEHALLTDMSKGYETIIRLICLIEKLA
eukprot:NODE_1070_length_1252_cov_257.777778.p1 GENE.NODE_1070_length_1252_cov_257.777778~~NODE_1070_length_1252_cov_257.777778.p1  ORF type:complete len:267 (-),score=75.59 NODE_1070_length_1252_cov_257.777778:136-936(-)